MKFSETFLAALLRAAFFLIILFAVASCDGDEDNNTPNNSSNNSASNNSNPAICSKADAALPECQGKPLQCEGCNPQNEFCEEETGECLNNCSAYTEETCRRITAVENSACDPDLGRCVIVEEPIIENPCENYWWIQQYQWYCPECGMNRNIELEIYEDGNYCMLDSIIWNPFSVPNDNVEIQESPPMITFYDQGLTIQFIPIQ